MTYEDAHFLKGEKWFTAFPWLKTAKLSGTMADMDDPDFWVVPAGTSIKNNFIYIDKANLADPEKMNVQYVYYPICEKYNEIIEPTSDEIVIFSSKRIGLPDIEEAIERASGTISLTVEEFRTIGRIK